MLFLVSSTLKKIYKKNTTVYDNIDYYCHHHHHHYAAVVSHGWAKASACRLQVSLSCAVLCQIVSLQYLARSSLHCLAGLPCHLFLLLWCPSGDTRGPSVFFEAVDMPLPGPFRFSQLLIISITFVLYLAQMFD